MTLKFCSLANGSSGNCQYIESDKVRILIYANQKNMGWKPIFSKIDVAL